MAWWPFGSARREREASDNALKHLLKETRAHRTPTFASLKGTLQISDRALLQVIERLRQDGFLQSDGASYRLTTTGADRARHVLRAHRLLERYLVDEARLPVTQVHDVAERLEHHLSEVDAERLSAALGHPEHDPHGDPIPRAGEDAEEDGRPITAWTAGEDGRIVHLEDEPAATFRALTQLGLAAGQRFRVDEVTPDALHLTVNGNPVVLPLKHAANVAAATADEHEEAPSDVLPLADVPTATTAEVVMLAPTAQGLTRRRLLDLGFTPGTRVTPVLETFAGDPRAYRVRGTTVALRRDQAAAVLVTMATAAASSGSETYEPRV